MYLHLFFSIRAAVGNSTQSVSLPPAGFRPLAVEKSHIKCHQPSISCPRGRTARMAATNRKESSPGVLTSTPVHRSEALRLGQRAIKLLKCHFQREMDGHAGRWRSFRTKLITALFIVCDCCITLSDQILFVYCRK